MRADLIAAYPTAADALQLESEPLTKWLQRTAYQVVNLQARMNEAPRP